VLLYLVRHAVAFERDPSRWPDDADRPLSPDGEDRFRPAARGLAVVAPAPDAVLSSPFVRTWRTAELLVEEAGWPNPVAEPALGAEASVEEAVKVVQDHAVDHATAMVGHEPNLSLLAAHLMTGGDGDVGIELKKGAVVCLDLDGAGEARLRWSVPPKILRAVASRGR
jgi:phosphohistidine phosphatase